jgi:phenylalanyl-tRNA synthetase beta chain
VLDNTVVGWLGLLHPAAARTLDINGMTALLEINLDSVLPAGATETRYQALPRFPSIQLDVSFEVDEAIDSQTLANAIHEGANTDLLRSCTLFANYHLDNGKKSVSFHLTFRSNTGSLTDPEVKGPFDQLVAHVTQSLGATLRGG